MLKKYILSLAILGLAAPHAAMGGFDLKTITHYAGFAINKMDQKRFWVGLGTGFCFMLPYFANNHSTFAKIALRLPMLPILFDLKRHLTPANINNSNEPLTSRSRGMYGVILGMLAGAVIFPARK